MTLCLLVLMRLTLWFSYEEQETEQAGCYISSIA